MRHFRTAAIGLLAVLVLSILESCARETDAEDKLLLAPKTIHVVVWDEQQPRAKKAYENFLGNAIADYLKTRPNLEVKSVALDDPDQGISDELLSKTDVIIWWGHVRHRDVKPELGKKIVDRIVA